jgi:hypothetical protein
MPVELERINTFPDNHTKLGDITDTKRAFFMGNALVTEVVTRLGISLAKAIETVWLWIEFLKLNGLRSCLASARGEINGQKSALRVCCEKEKLPAGGDI